MRCWMVVLVACSAPPRTVSNTTVSMTPDPAPCGFTDFAALDAAAWAARGDNATPPAVGTCRLHTVEIQVTRYVLRSGDRDIAQITMEGTMLVVPGLAVEGFTVGSSSDVALDRHPPDRFRIQCLPTSLGNTCSFRSIKSNEESRVQFVVGGDLAGQLDGIAAYEFFRHKPLRGVLVLTRL